MGGSYTSAEPAEAQARAATGLPPDVVGERVLHAIRHDELFVFTHPESFNIHHDCGLPGLVRRVQIGGGECSAQSMVRHNLGHSDKALEMVFVELARLRRAQGGEDAGWRRAEDRCVRHVSHFRRTSSAAEVFSAVCAAAVEPRGDRQPPSITPIAVRIVPHIQERRVGP